MPGEAGVGGRQGQESVTGFGDVTRPVRQAFPECDGCVARVAFPNGLSFYLDDGMIDSVPRILSGGSEAGWTARMNCFPEVCLICEVL